MKKLQRIQIKLIAGGWMVFVDGKQYMSYPNTMHIAESIAHNAKLLIQRGLEKSLYFNQ
jgi:hypothetical protein